MSFSEMDAVEPLVPDPSFLFDGTRSAEDFKAIGRGYLQGYLIPQGRLAPHHGVLDIGSGNGKLARVLVDYLDQDGSYCGFDVVRAGIDWCKEHYKDDPRFRFDHADIQSDFYNSEATQTAETFVFPYEDESFDVCFAGSLFTHIGPAASANYLRQSARVLRPGGRLVFTCTLINEHNLGYQSRPTLRERAYTRVSAFHHVLDPSQPSKGVAHDESSMRRMVADAGLIVSTMLFGLWANGEAVVPGFQDCIVALKPKSG